MNLDKEVAEWLTSLEFFWHPEDGYWLHDHVDGITPDQATFFYTATKRAELKAEIRIHDEYWHSQKLVEKNGIGPVALANKEATELQLWELEAQLNQTNTKESET